MIIALHIYNGNEHNPSDFRTPRLHKAEKNPHFKEVLSLCNILANVKWHPRFYSIHIFKFSKVLSYPEHPRHPVPT